MSNVKQETLNGAKWVMINKCIMKPANFLYFMVLARLITPSEMGILGLTAIFYVFTDALKEAGMGAALIRKQNRTNIDCSTVFWYNLAINILISSIFWFIAPWFADFFNIPDLKWTTRVSCIMTIFGASQSVHYTLYAARRDFKPPTIISIITTLLGMPLTLYLAYTGWSYWSLIISGAFSNILGFIIIWIVSPWKPQFIFSMQSFKEFFSFGFKLSLSGCVWRAYTEIINFIIGKFYSPAQLALYNRAYHLANLPNQTIFQPISGILYPILSTIQEDEEKLNAIYRKYIRICIMPMIWIMITLTTNAESIILLLYGESWINCAEYLQLLCLGFCITPLIMVNHSYMCVKGRSDLLLKREILIRCFGLPIMLCAAYFSVSTICWAYFIFSLWNFYITLSFTKKVSHIPTREQIRDVAPYLFGSILVNLPSIILQISHFSPCNLIAFICPSIALISYITWLHKRRDDAYILLRDTIWNCNVIHKIRQRFSF